MADDPKEKPRKRVVVEEVGTSEASEPKEAAVKAEPVEEIKEKVGELQTITEHMAGDVEKSANVQEDIAKAAEQAAPSEAAPFIKSPNGPNPLLIIIPGIFLLGALLGGIWFYQKNINKTSGSGTTPVESLSPATSPTASPSGQLDLTKYPVSVENGSGIAGTAAAAKDLLTQAGFTVSGTGNADSFDFTETIIKTKSDVPQEFIDKLTKTLSAAYQVGTPKSLPDSSTDEVVVIVGSSKAQ